MEGPSTELPSDAYSHQQLLTIFSAWGIQYGRPVGCWCQEFQGFILQIHSYAKVFFEELSTLLAKIGDCLNYRLLTPMSEDTTDLLALTPGHILVGVYLP